MPNFALGTVELHGLFGALRSRCARIRSRRRRRALWCYLPGGDRHWLRQAAAEQ